MRVTLWKCPQCGGIGTRLEPPCHHSLYGIGLEPIVFAPLPSEETRSKIIDSVRCYTSHLSYDSSQGSADAAIARCEAALTEIEECWKEGT